MIPAAGTYERVPVLAGYRPEPPLFGVGQVITVLIDNVPTTATVTSADIRSDGFHATHLYLPERDEYVWCHLQLSAAPQSPDGRNDG